MASRSFSPPATAVMFVTLAAFLIGCPSEQPVDLGPRPIEMPPEAEIGDTSEKEEGKPRKQDDDSTTATTPREEGSSLSAEELAELRRVGREPLRGTGDDHESDKETPSHDKNHEHSGSEPCPSCPSHQQDQKAQHREHTHHHHHHHDDEPYVFDGREELMGRWRVLELASSEPGDTVVPSKETYVVFEPESYRIEKGDQIEVVDYRIRRITGRRLIVRPSHRDSDVTMRFIGRDDLRVTDPRDNVLMVLTR